MKKIKKVICFLLVLSVILAFTVEDKAEASGLAAGLAITGSVVLTGTVLTSLAIIAANGAGMSEALRQAAQADGKSVRQYTSGKLTEYRRQNGMSLQSVLTTMLEMGYSPTGALKMGYNVASWWTGFLNWLWSAEGGNLIDSAIPNEALPEYVTVNGYRFRRYDLNTQVTIQNVVNYYDANKPIMYGSTSTLSLVGYMCLTGVSLGDSVYVCQSNNTSNCYYYVYASNSNVQISKNIYRTRNGEGSGVIIGSTSTQYKVTRQIGYENQYWGTLQYNNYGLGVSNPTLTNANSFPIENAPGNQDFSEVYGNPVGGYDENPDVYYLPPDTNIPTAPPQWKVLDTGGSVRIEDQGVEQTDIEGNILLDDYIRGLSDSIATDAPVSIPIEMANDVVVPYDIAIPGTAAIPVTQVAEGENASIDNAEDIGEETNIDQLEPYMLDLTSFFPFCIPFDIYNMLSLFRATRQAPSFDWRFYVPRVVDYTLTIDLSAFDTVASVLRTLELIAFCVALAFATKHIIQGGD